MPLAPMMLTRLGPLFGTGSGGMFVPPKATNVPLAAVPVDAVCAYFMHQRRTVVVSAGGKGDRMNELARIVENVGRNIREAVHLHSAIRHASQEDRDVIVGVGTRLAPRARTE